MTWKIDHRIADPCNGYPECEARFQSVSHWLNYMADNGFVWEGWRISLGHCGPTDCQLVLHNPNGQSKSYGIEGEGWLALDEFWHRQTENKLVPLGRAEEIWEMEP